MGVVFGLVRGLSVRKRDRSDRTVLGVFPCVARRQLGLQREGLSLRVPRQGLPWLPRLLRRVPPPLLRRTALDAGDGTFNYTSDSNKANWPDIKLQIQRDGEWEDWAVVSWKSGSRVITLHDDTTTTGSKVKVPADTENFRTAVTLENTEAGEGADEALQAGINYDVRAVIILKSTESMMDLIDAAFENSNTPAMAVYNGVNMLIERADVPKDDADRQIHSIDREGYDSIRGYTTDTAVYPYKSSTQKLSEVDYEARTILIHYEAKVEERSVIAEKKTWQEAVDEGGSRQILTAYGETCFQRE